MNYQEFLEKKRELTQDVGFLINKEELNPKLFDFQKDTVAWALRKGRSAIFFDCGLGKTFIQLEWANQIYKKVGGKVLILAPLAVSHQTVREGEKFGITIKYVSTQEKVEDGISITNYEKLSHFNPDEFSAIVLDESSILKSYTGKIRNDIIESFKNTKYKLACTATPSPNDFTELGNHCEFLGISTRSEMLSMFFINDTANVGTWRLKGHAKQKYWEWVSSWAMMITNPKDLGYTDQGFDLPKLIIKQHTVESNAIIGDYLFKQQAETLEERRIARRESIQQRVKKTLELVSQKPNDQWLIWCDYNQESEMLAKMIPNAIEVTGSDTDEHKQNSMLGFANEEVKVLVSKPKIAGFGMNWQSCHNVVYCGISDSYESFYQSVRRCYRFGQKHDVNVHIVVSDIEENVTQNIKRKEKQAIEMQKRMISELNKYELQEIKGSVKQIMEYKTNMKQGENYKAILGDSIEKIQEIKSGSIHYQLFSPPFASLFTYSNSERDLGNSSNNDEFMEHYKFLAKEQFRISMPGRLLSFHVMNLPSTISSDGYIGIKDLRGDLIRLYQEVGFIFHSEVVIWKDPLVQATRTKTLTLAHKQVSKDSSRVGQGFPDYIVTMRKPGENPEPVAKGRGFENYIGELPEPTHQKNDDPRKNKYSHLVWQRYASPVWFDINQTRTLNGRHAKEHADEKHVCPLQLDVTERCIELWTNPNDIVFSPFMGIGSEGYSALKLNRRFIGIELKETYYNEAVKNLEHAIEERNMVGLFAEVE